MLSRLGFFARESSLLREESDLSPNERKIKHLEKDISQKQSQINRLEQQIAAGDPRFGSALDRSVEITSTLETLLIPDLKQIALSYAQDDESEQILALSSQLRTVKHEHAMLEYEKEELKSKSRPQPSPRLC